MTDIISEPFITTPVEDAFIIGFVLLFLGFYVFVVRKSQKKEKSTP